MVDRVLVCTAAPSAIEQSFHLADRGGTVLVFAPMPPGETLALPMHNLWKRCIGLVHSYAGPPAEMAAALELIAMKRIDVASMITHRLNLDQAAIGFRMVAEAGECLKVLIDPGQR